ncbi:MAG: Gfo/Idh/MocA family oxidoreductase [Phycisphaerales bacterium]|nr:Gfo/Idh/MocA family oxidoreductase [Phycisphaerales bacterium]
MQQQDPVQNASRREFLTTSAAAAIGATALLGAAASAQPVDRAPRNNDPIPRAAKRAPLGRDEAIRMAVIGTGGMGTGHCHAFMNLAQQGHEKVEIVALCDVCEPRLEDARAACAEKQGITVDTYTRHEDLLKRNDIHGVLVAAPEHWHAPLSEAAIASGKDVYCEKPMTLRLQEAVRLYRVANANPDIILQVGTQMIMLPKYKAARDLIKEGAIGKPTFSQTSYCRNSLDGEWLYYGIDPEWAPGKNLDWKRWCGWLGDMPWDPEVYARWRRYRKTSTGIIGDLLVHVMTPLLYALDMGWPTRVVASGGHYVDTAMDNHDQVNLTIEFEDGHTMIVAGSTCNEVGLETMIRGHKANLYLNSRHCVLRPERLFVDDIDERTVECPDIGNDQDQLRLNWLRSIRTREPNASTVDLAMKCMVIVDLATRSMWEGQAFRFDPRSMEASRA